MQMKITGIAPWIRPIVVELLRCAADLCVNGTSAMPIDDAATELFGSEEHNLERTCPAFDIACTAIEDLDLGPCSVEQLLEAALLIERKEWP